MCAETQGIEGHERDERQEKNPRSPAEPAVGATGALASETTRAIFVFHGLRHRALKSTATGVKTNERCVEKSSRACRGC